MLLRPHRHSDIHRTYADPVMSAQAAPPPPLPELPPEIWLKIFRIATFIPRETDTAATTEEPWLFCTYNYYQTRALKAVLPLRRTIVQVSRRFYQIGAEVLYTHINLDSPPNPDQRLLLFLNLLVLRPELGRFVKRLFLRRSVEDEEMNYQIISRCPNLVIFSSESPRYYINEEPWWSRGLPKTIRNLDITVSDIPTNHILELLAMMPQLEILYLSGVQHDTISHAPVHLSALRILGIYLDETIHDTNPILPILSAMQLPRLIALAGNKDLQFSLPLDVWQRLEYIKTEIEVSSGLRPDYMHSLRDLYLTVDLKSVGPSLGSFPFHQLECLTLQVLSTRLFRWEEVVEVLVVLPLDVTAMPKLKLFQLEWGHYGIYHVYHKSLYRLEDRKQFIQYFEGLVTRFEQRGVIFAETHRRDICPGFQPIRDVLAACKLL